VELTGKRALITGATGFIGRHLARHLIATQGCLVRGLARSPQAAEDLAMLGAEVVEGDLTDPASLRTAIQGRHLVFHTAGWVGERGTREQAWEVNVTGTQNLVEVSLEAGLDRFVHLSSCAVYASLQAFDIDENTPTRMRGNPYADSKVAAEGIVFRAHRERGLPAVVARASQVYGPGSRQFTLRPVEVIKAGKMILVNGGRYLCKPVYIDNLVDGLILCAKVPRAIGEAINLTDGIAVPWRDFFGAYGRMLGVEGFPSVPFPVAWAIGLFYEIRARLRGKKSTLNRAAVRALRSRNSFSNTKARDLIGWEPKVGLVEGMRRTETWLRAEGILPPRSA
jgi:nucleoside-diphosphate-sugar epimerase